MMQSQRLSEDAVLGSSYQITNEALTALQRGDTQALIDSHRSRFGNWRMEKDDDEDESDDDDDAEDGDDDDEDEDDESDDDEDEEDGPEDKKSKKAAKGKKDDSPEGLKRKNAALEDEKNRLFRGREKARKERDDALSELQKLKKDGQGDEELKAQVSTLEKSNETLSSDLESARLQIAFLSDNTYEWVNPGQALKLVDLSDVEIDDDGKVLGLVSALDKLAEDSPHMLKQKRRTTPAPKGGPTGSKPKPKPKAKDKAREAAIAEKYKIGR